MESEKKKIHIIGGGTVSHVRSHMDLCATAYGNTARQLEQLCKGQSDKYEVQLHLTKMANSGQGNLETNEDIENLLEELVKDPSTKMIFMTAALVDYRGKIRSEDGEPTASGKYEERLKTREQIHPVMDLEPTEKLINKIRKERKDIYVVGFKTTQGASTMEQYISGLHLLKESSCNLVLANDRGTRTNMIITPEESRYNVTQDRAEVLRNLVEIAYSRAEGHFTRSKLVEGEPVSWNSENVPESLRVVVNHCIEQGAYKPVRGSTAGHFAVKVDDSTFLTSRRKTNFNHLDKVGLVKVVTEGEDNVIAYGSRPSVGGQSQRIVFAEHPEYDCIVHFHCPPKDGIVIPTRSQREYECGSHECGKNTSAGLQKKGDLSVVYLDNHGPNIVFNSATDPQKVIQFINEHFDLTKKTGGPVAM